ncbi:Plant self-incompatibility S1 [Macleaya cordata]|uniref:S-protein homolog n=1 Tax=Macleaya cordata TaxID=56857 RepID=A0A200Q5L4_MACCD|nr:Plant self-incompatibility S1 [Macleaya cordata]
MGITKSDRKVLIVVVAILVMSSSMFVAVNAFYFSKKTIHLQNDLEGGESLWVHCKSKDDDLGEHVLRTGQAVQWSFRPNIWGTTLFYCYVSRGRGVVGFDIYGGHASSYAQCGAWSARWDGIYYAFGRTDCSDPASGGWGGAVSIP